MTFELAALAYLADMLFGEFPCKHKPALGLSVNPVNSTTLAQALAMKTGVNLIVLSLLAAGILLT
jgi:hypothetical protein